MRPHGSRMALIDALKGTASQLIVLHHLAFYGPMSDTAAEIAPGLIAWLFDYGRLAVQAFLVIGGFLAARALAPSGVMLQQQPLIALWRRYTALVMPFAAALLIASIGAAIARTLFEHDATPAAPGVGQFLAHVFLVHNLLDADALSAGVWYVAIDFQLYLLLTLLLFAARRAGERLGHADWISRLLVVTLGLGSLLLFNRMAELDVWGIYFFGAYALGVCAYWISQQRHALIWQGLMFCTGVFALLVQFRIRIAIALAVAMLLSAAARSPLMSWPRSRLLGWLGKISYSVFLIHFPVCLIVNAIMHQANPDSPLFNLLGMGIAWLLSIAAGALFHTHVEQKVRRLRPGLALPLNLPRARRLTLAAITTGLGLGLAIKPLL